MLDTIATEFTDPFGRVSVEIAALRLLVAMLLAGAIGWERERRDKPAGLRTHILIAVAACVFTLLGFELATITIESSERLRVDPLRLIEAVTAGVAFLAAGTIITGKGGVRGLTTGAGMWLAGAIGLACGMGEIPLAVLATALTLMVLWLLRRLEAVIHGNGD